MSIDNSHKIETVKILLAKGVDGIGIEKIEKTGTSGLVDTYTITYTDSRKTTFTITNGNGIASVEKTNTSGLVDTYTITFDDGSTETFNITNGRGITKIEKTATVGNVDTYTITYNDGTTSTYEVTNGAGSSASGITFTNNGEGATNVQDAVDNTLELIAPIQLTLTADKTYNAGDQFVYEGLLYEVTATIASGTAITIGSNAQLADTVAEQLSAINSNLVNLPRTYKASKNVSGQSITTPVGNIYRTGQLTMDISSLGLTSIDNIQLTLASNMTAWAILDSTSTTSTLIFVLAAAASGNIGTGTVYATILGS